MLFSSSKNIYSKIVVHFDTSSRLNIPFWPMLFLLLILLFLFPFQDSTIIDFYPDDFKIDLNGKKFAWQGVALLPFVDENRLFKALIPLHSHLTDEEGKN